MITYEQLQNQLQKVMEHHGLVARAVSERAVLTLDPDDVTITTRHGGRRVDYGRYEAEAVMCDTPVKDVLDGYDRHITKLRADAKPDMVLLGQMLGQVEDMLTGAA